MKEDKQTTEQFTKKGVYMGVIAYLIVFIMVLWVFS